MDALTLFSEPPAGLFDLPAHRLAEVLPGPSVVCIPGVGRPIFLSVLLHGNETSGWTGVCRYVCQQTGNHRPLLLFIANVAAAAADVRALPGQQDYNRIWHGATGAEAALAEQVLELVKRTRPFAALDLHNNTGRNPHYSVLTEITPQTLGLAQLFSDTAVLVEEPDTVLTRALQSLCPAITVELGPMGDIRSDERALGLIRTFTELADLPSAARTDLRLHRALARVHVLPGTPFSFADSNQALPLATPLVLTAGMESVNFHPIPPGTVLGTSDRPVREVLKVLDHARNDVTDRYLQREGLDVVFREPVIPAMYTTDLAVIRQDCLCYLMQRMV